MPLLGATLIFFIKRSHFKLIRSVALGWSTVIFNFSVYFLLFFDPTTTKFQYTYKVSWLKISHDHFVLGIDGPALLLILLTTLLIPVCLLLG
jgi:NADH-ubiquinone oxidoreductase chain 4